MHNSRFYTPESPWILLSQVLGTCKVARILLSQNGCKFKDWMNTMSNGISGLQSQHWAFLASSCLYLCLSSGFHLPFLALFLLLKIAFCVSFMILSFSHLLSFLSHFCLLEIMQLVWVDREKMSFSVEHPSIQIHLKTKLYSIQYAPCQINPLSIEKQILKTFLRIYQTFI